MTNFIFQTKSQFFFKVWIILKCNVRSLFCTFLAETLYGIDKINTSKCKFLYARLLALKFTKFLISLLESNIRLFFKLWVMRHNSSGLSHLNRYMLWTKESSQSAHFQIFWQFQLRNYRRIISHYTEEWSKLWKKKNWLFVWTTRLEIWWFLRRAVESLNI